MTGHRCDTGIFDRTLCPEPCDTMHSFCATCGKRQDPCAHDGSNHADDDDEPFPAVIDLDAIEARRAVLVALEPINHRQWLRAQATIVVEDIPALVARVRELEAENAGLRAKVERAQKLAGEFSGGMYGAFSYLIRDALADPKEA